MELRYRVAATLLTAALVAGCGGAAPASDNAKAVNAPPAAPAPAQTPSAEKAADVPVEAAQPVAAAPKPPETPAVPAPAPATPAAAPDAPPPVQALAFSTLQKGAYSGVAERKAVLLTDEAGWKANWAQASARQVPGTEAPVLDFSQQSVVAVYMGEQRTGGYAIEITGVELTNGTLRVTVKQTRPGPGTIVTQALTQPFHMVRIPKVPEGTKLEVNW
ncbi:MAG TPA: protease complex subunit PrcB family protein [Symbiobacteriaceae bacterium]|nr:protease complex subunit PrcB family protein [Symbiobacteriaceae bacterium]